MAAKSEIAVTYLLNSRTIQSFRHQFGTGDGTGTRPDYLIVLNNKVRAPLGTKLHGNREIAGE